MDKDLKLDDCQLMYGDCLERMKEISDGSVDMILCDLPYGVLNRNNPNAKWDIIIPFEDLWQQYKRVIKLKGSIVLFAQGLFTSKLMISNLSWWKYNVIWNKILKSGFLNANRQPLRQHEDICVFCSGQTVYNPQMALCDPRQKNHRRHKIGGELCGNITNRCYGKFGDIKQEITNKKYPTSIISIPKQHINGKCYHPTEKPVALLEYLIRTYTNEGEMVLDNCAGSMSTVIAALNTKRNCIAIEKDTKYFEIGKERVTNHIKTNHIQN